ncbi:MAG: hypothetical protein WCI94_00685 [Rhodospirillales bacterium]
MSTAIMPEAVHPSIAVTEPSTGHAMPFVAAIIMFLAITVIAVWIAGPLR